MDFDSDSSPPIPDHVLRDRDRIDALTKMRTMTSEARNYNASDSPGSNTSSPGSITGSIGTSASGRRRRQTMTTSPLKPSSIAGGKRRTKKTCGGKRHKKSKTSKKRGHKKSKTHKKHGHKKRA